jgi:hypothetical protein
MIRGWKKKLGGRLGASVRRRRLGAEVLEAALVMPILLAMGFGTVEFGYYFYTEHNLEGAAREGARAAIPAQFGDTIDSVDTAARLDKVEDAVDRVMGASGYQPSEYDIVANWIDSGSGPTMSKYISVSVELHWQDVSPGLRPMQMIKPEHDLVKGNATMRLEF